MDEPQLATFPIKHFSGLPTLGLKEPVPSHFSQMFYGPKQQQGWSSEKGTNHWAPMELQAGGWSHFTDTETEAQRDGVTEPWAHGKVVSGETPQVPIFSSVTFPIPVLNLWLLASAAAFPGRGGERSLCVLSARRSHPRGVLIRGTSRDCLDHPHSTLDVLCGPRPCPVPSPASNSSPVEASSPPACAEFGSGVVFRELIT